MPVVAAIEYSVLTAGAQVGGVIHRGFDLGIDLVEQATRGNLDARVRPPPSDAEYADDPDDVDPIVVRPPEPAPSPH